MQTRSLGRAGVLLLIAMALLGVGGCPQIAALNLGPSHSLDGSWRLTVPGWGTACLTVTSEKVSTWDGGCTGNFMQIYGSQPANKSADRVVWVLDTDAGTGAGRVTLDLTWQSDGSLSGDAILLPAGSYSPMTLPGAVMTRQE